MKRYALFEGREDIISASTNGWGCMTGTYDTVHDAFVAVGDADWWHVIDLQTGETMRIGGIGMDGSSA